MDKKLATMFAMGARDSTNAVYKQMYTHLAAVRAVFERAQEHPEEELLTNADVVRLLKTLETAISKDAVLANTLYNVEIDTLTGKDPYEGSA